MIRKFATGGLVTEYLDVFNGDGDHRQCSDRLRKLAKTAKMMQSGTLKMLPGKIGLHAIPDVKRAETEVVRGSVERVTIQD